MNPSHSDRIPSVHCSLSILCPKNFYPMGGRLSHRISRGAHAPRGNFQPRREQLVLLTFRWAILRCTLLASCSAGLHGSKFPLTTVRTSITHPYTEFPFSFFSLDLYKCLWTCLILSRSINIYSIKYPAKKIQITSKGMQPLTGTNQSHWSRGKQPRERMSKGKEDTTSEETKTFLWKALWPWGHISLLQLLQ